MPHATLNPAIKTNTPAHQPQGQQPKQHNPIQKLAEVRVKVRRHKKARVGEKSELTNTGLGRESAITVRKKLAKARKKRKDGHATLVADSDDNETVDGEVPHRGNLPKPATSYQGHNPGFQPASWAASANTPGPFGAQIGYAAPPYTPQSEYTTTPSAPQFGYAAPSFLPQHGCLHPQPSYFPAPAPTHQPYTIHLVPTQPFTWQLPPPTPLSRLPLAQMVLTYPTAPTFPLARCQHCNTNIADIEYSTGFTFAAGCPVCWGARGYHSQLPLSQWQAKWF